MQLLRPMQSVSVEVIEGAEAGTYTSRVLDFSEGEQILIGALLERGREVRLQPGTAVQLQFAQPDGIHVLSTHVLERSATQPSLRLAWPGEPERIQRRSHARADVLVRCRVSVSRPDIETEQLLPALTSNLSAGGTMVTLPELLEPDTQVRITLQLPELGDRSCEAHVARSGETEGAAQNHRFWAALEFAGMLESVREDLTQFVFGVRREQSRQGVA